MAKSLYLIFILANFNKNFLKGITMKVKILVLLTSMYLAGCAAYKELKPDPEVSSVADGYIEIKDGDDNFELEKDKKYFVHFPAPFDKNFYLVINVDNKDLMQTFLTPYFDDGKGQIVKIEDESADPLKTCYYPVDNSVQNFYWVIESVQYDLVLNMDYRFVPQWRYKFETRYAQFQETLTNNTVDRVPYNGIGLSTQLSDFDFGTEVSRTIDMTSSLKQVEKELEEIESIFPPSILNTEDEAYQNYRTIKKEVQEELGFQKNYHAFVNVMDKEKSSRRNAAAFEEAVPDILTLFEQKDSYPNNVLAQTKKVIFSRLPELVPYYEKKLADKRDSEPIALKTDQLEKVYQSAGKTVPANVSALNNFVKMFNGQIQSLNTIESDLQSIDQSVRSQSTMPSNTYFSGIITKVGKLKYNLPKGSSSFGKYANYTCAQQLSSKRQSLNSRINLNLDGYRSADGIVPQLNRYKSQKQYRGMIRLLKQNFHLDFLTDVYKSLDNLSLDQQALQVRTAMNNANWAEAETNLRSFHQDKNFLRPTVIGSQKSRTVKTLDDTLSNRISRISKQRVRKFVAENINTLSNVEALYGNTAFNPIYEMTFSSVGPADLERKKLVLNGELTYMKEQYFPSTAIKKLYTDFVKNPQNDGVIKARAIATHGDQYKGDDKQVKTWAAECNPWASKWITKAKDYRKLFALPINDSQNASNEYVFRLNIRIPSEAKFPTFDINVKLPKEVAKDAASEQWYKSITLNKDPIKNEGYYTITAPSTSNDYECQITPVRMRKDEDNILEIRFNNPKFKVYEVSIMAQKPIIKKN